MAGFLPVLELSHATGPWQTGPVHNRRRENAPTPGGGAYSIVDWDDETGDADIVEYDDRGLVVCRREWRIFSGPPAVDGTVGEVVTFDPWGAVLDRQSPGPAEGLRAGTGEHVATTSRAGRSRRTPVSERSALSLIWSPARPVGAPASRDQPC
jgi:hypothetical protein